MHAYILHRVTNIDKRNFFSSLGRNFYSYARTWELARRETHVINLEAKSSARARIDHALACGAAVPCTVGVLYTNERILGWHKYKEKRHGSGYPTSLASETT